MQRKQNTKAKSINKRGETSAVKTKERGITLIALIVTIIVLIILAVVSINAIFGADGLVEQARKTNLMVEFMIYIDEKKTYDSEKAYQNSDYVEESLNAGRTTLIYNTQEDTGGNIQTVIPSMSNEMAEKFEIIKGEFLLYAADDLEREVATELGIALSPYLIEDGVLLSANTNLELVATNGVVTIPERVTEIGEGAFSGVEGVTEIIVPSTVRIIQKNAFSYNDEIEKVTIEPGVLEIGESAFEECSSLTEIIIPDSVMTIGIFAFRSCYNLTTVQMSNNVTSIYSQVFNGCSSLTTINMPNNLTSITYRAFGYCYNLENLNIPAGVTSIDTGAFTGCTNLNNLTIDEANETYEIENGIIYAKDNSTLIMLAPMANEKTVTIRDGVKNLEAYSLEVCTSMTTLNLPSSIEYISGLAFPSNTMLETINIPVSNEYYYEENGCIYSDDGKELVYVVATKTQIDISENVEVILSGAFNGSNATEVIIPDNVREIQGNAFHSNELEKVYIGKGVNNLTYDFKSWGGSMEVEIDSENQYYKVENNLILTKDGKKVITFCEDNVQTQEVPEGVEELGNSAFAGFYYVKEILLPNTLRVIGDNCFADCDSMKEIEIPNSVGTISSTAFNLCDVLETVRIDKEQGSISGSPWSAPKGERSIIWLR